jgi:hypothetical protein
MAGDEPGVPVHGRVKPDVPVLLLYRPQGGGAIPLKIHETGGLSSKPFLAQADRRGISRAG